MRILFLTNYYPPHSLGGLERSCQDVLEALVKRDHACLLLTSMHGTGNRRSEEGRIRRWLYPEMDMRPIWNAVTFFTRRKQRETHNLVRLEETVAEFRPDVIFIWGMWNLHRSLAVLAERLLPGRVAYRFADYWPTLPSQHELYWRHEPRGRLTSLPKRLIRGIALSVLARERQEQPLRFDHVMCVSDATRQELLEAGVPVTHARVIHTGLDPESFSSDGRIFRSEPGDPLAVLYAGRLNPDKGVHTAVEALARLSGEQQRTIRLDIAGSGPVPYVKELKGLAERAGVADRVTFLGQVPPEEMPALLRARDILVVPSIWPEPFARVVLEGMMSGMVVVATANGGTSEILVDGHTGLFFPAADENALAERLEKLRDDPGLGKRLGQAAGETVGAQFSKTAMIEAIEAFLSEAARAPARAVGTG